MQNKVLSSRAQFSVDALFAILGTLLVLSSLQIIVEEISASQKEIAIANQETVIANSLAEIVHSGQAMSDGKFKVTYTIPKIIVPGEKEKKECNIMMKENEVTVTYNAEKKVIERKASLILDSQYKTKIELPFAAVCGQTITFGDLP